MAETPLPIRTAILLFDGCDLLDVGGPYEVLLTASRLAVRRGDPAPFEVRTVAGSAGETVAAYGGLHLGASEDPATIGPIDLLIVPGLVDLDAALGDDALLATISDLAGRSRVVTSVCTGAFLLAAVGRLHGRRATTHHEDTVLLRKRDDVGEVVDGVRWVDDGDVITAAGLSSGLAFGLHLVHRFVGRELARATAAQIEHPWDPDAGMTRPDPAG